MNNDYSVVGFYFSWQEMRANGKCSMLLLVKMVWYLSSSSRWMTCQWMKYCCELMLGEKKD